MMMPTKESHDRQEPQRVTESTEPPPFGFVSHVRTGLQGCMAMMCEQSQKLASVFLSLNIPPLLAVGLMGHGGPPAGLEHTVAIHFIQILTFSYTFGIWYFLFASKY